MSAQAILDNMETLIGEAVDGVLSDEQVTRYETLEAELKTANKTDEILKRNEAYRTNVTPVIHATAKTDDTLGRAFGEYLRTGKESAELVELRAQSAGTNSAGGYTVPRQFRDKIVARMVAFGGVANVAETINTESGSPLDWATLDDTGNVGEIVAENGTFAAGADLVFGTATLGAYKYMAGGTGALPLRVSWELLQDSEFDIEALVADKLGERIARIQAQHLVLGTGSSQPKGLVHGKAGIQTALNTGVISYADLVKFTHSVDPAYRASAKWAFNDTTLAQLQTLVDTTGRPLLTQSGDSISGTPGGTRLLGYDVVIDQAFPNITAGSATVNWGAFGDFKEGYVIRRVRDIQVIVNPWTRAANGQVEYSAWARMDAVPQNANAYVSLTCKV